MIKPVDIAFDEWKDMTGDGLDNLDNVQAVYIVFRPSGGNFLRTWVKREDGSIVPVTLLQAFPIDWRSIESGRYTDGIVDWPTRMHSLIGKRTYVFDPCIFGNPKLDGEFADWLESKIKDQNPLFTDEAMQAAIEAEKPEFSEVLLDAFHSRTWDIEVPVRDELTGEDIRYMADSSLEYIRNTIIPTFAEEPGESSEEVC